MDNQQSQPQIDTPQAAPTQQSGVWLSREEYDRLRAASMPAATAIGSGPSPDGVLQPKRDYRNAWTYVAGAAAMLLFLAFIIPNNGGVFGVIVGIALLGFAVLALISFLHPRTQVPGQKTKNTAVKGLIIILGVVAGIFAAPMLFFFGFIFFLILTVPAGTHS